MSSALALAVLFGLPGFALLAVGRARGAAPWPWPRGVAVGLASGVALAGVGAIALGAFGVYSLRAQCIAMGLVVVTMLASGRSRVAWPLTRASVVESLGFVLVGLLAAQLFLAHPFEMLFGERDATVYTVSGIGLARQGSLVLHDGTADRIGPEAMRRFYPLPTGVSLREHRRLRVPQYVKYPGFYYTGADRREIIAQGLPLLPALVAIFYSVAGLDGAFVVNNFVGILAVLSVVAAGSSLVGESAAVLAGGLLALDAIEVWTAGYSVAEILFQMLLFAGFAAYLRGDRLGRGIAGFLLAATLFAKVEAALLIVPIGVYAAIAASRGRRSPGAAFWVGFAAAAVPAAAYWVCFQADYVQKAYRTFSHLHSRLGMRFFAMPGSWWVASMLLVTAGASIGFALHSAGRRRELSRPVARGLAIGVVLFVTFGYWIRPHMVGLVAGQGKTLVWLSWYVSPAVLLLGFVGLAHFLWTRANAENLFVLSILVVLAGVFLHFTFVNLIQIYMTRRFVPVALPMVLLFFAYLVTTTGSAGTGRLRAAASLVALFAYVAALHTIIGRSRHLYAHREYPGLARSFQELADSLRHEDLVFLSDGKARNLLGPALEFAFGVNTLVVWPPAYAKEKPLIDRWIDEGTAIGALTVEKPLEEVPGAGDFEAVGHEAWWISVLGQVEDRFPTEVSQDTLTVNRYAAGPGSDPLYDLWRREGARIAKAVCDRSVRLLGGNRFLLRRVRAACPADGVAGETMGYLVGAAEADIWQATLECYGARFVRSDLGGVVLFDEVTPRDDAGSTQLVPSSLSLVASAGRGSEHLAVDGRLETRWGSGVPQRPGMTFQVDFGGPTDVTWVRIRMGRFATDRARALALETSVDGQLWNRQVVPKVVDGIRWREGIPEENANGDVDLWVNARGVRALRLVNLGESSRFDWSIAELEIDGRPSR